MYELFNEIEFYNPEDVLNPFFLLLNNEFPKSFYQYFKKMNKPERIISVTGIQFELSKDINIKDLINKITEDSFKILQMDINKPLKISNNTYFITLFNISEDILIQHIFTILENIKKEKLTIGIFICHPLTIVNEFISKTNNQLNHAKKSNCILSVLNLLED